MRGLRRTKGLTVTETAVAFGCSASHISRVELGENRPSRALVCFYEERFEGDGMLLSLFETVDHAAEQARRRAAGSRATVVRAEPGDASTFIADTIPDGTVMAPGELFVKSWTIRNSGTVPWLGRRLERQGPLIGPGLIVSPASVEIEDTPPEETVTIWVGLRAPGFPCSSIAYFKMVSGDAYLCFPDSYEIGLEVLVRTVGERPPDEPVLQLRQ